MNHPDTTLLSVTTVGVKTFHMISRVKGVVRTKPPFGSASVLHFRKQRKFLEQATTTTTWISLPRLIFYAVACRVNTVNGRRQ